MGRYKEFKEIQSRYICFLRVLRRLNWIIYKDLGKMICRWIVISYATELYENETNLIELDRLAFRKSGSF